MRPYRNNGRGEVGYLPRVDQYVGWVLGGSLVLVVRSQRPLLVRRVRGGQPRVYSEVGRWRRVWRALLIGIAVRVTPPELSSRVLVALPLVVGLEVSVVWRVVRQQRR